MPAFLLVFPFPAFYWIKILSSFSYFVHDTLYFYAFSNCSKNVSFLKKLTKYKIKQYLYPVTKYKGLKKDLTPISYSVCYYCVVFYVHFVYYPQVIIIFNERSVYFIQLVASCFFLFLPSRYNSPPQYCFGHSLTDALGLVTSYTTIWSENASLLHSLLNDNLTRSRLLYFLIFF